MSFQNISYQWWVNQEGDTLCGLYNNEATELGWHRIDINRLQVQEYSSELSSKSVENS